MRLSETAAEVMRSSEYISYTLKDTPKVRRDGIRNGMGKAVCCV